MILFSDLPFYTRTGGQLIIHVWHIVFWVLVLGVGWQLLRSFFLTRWLCISLENLLIFLSRFVLEKSVLLLQGIARTGFETFSRIMSTLWQYRIGKILLLGSLLLFIIFCCL